MMDEARRRTGHGKLARTFSLEATTSIGRAAAVFLLLPMIARAWSGAGHEVIAVEAYRELPPALQQTAVQFFKAHPQYEKWAGSIADGPANPDFGLGIFMRASTWPDEIRRGESKYNHPKWHYIDYPLKPPKFRFVPAPSPDDDILYGIQQCEKTLSDRKASPEERAVYLSWLIHLVADLHQPLHCSSLFNSAYPDGDKGGNYFFVRPADQAIPLHRFWDGLLGTSGNLQNRRNYAIAIQSDYPRKALKELRKARTPKDWSLEGRDIAVEKVYLRGKLQGGTSKETAADLPGGYSKAAKSAAERQAALAGYRLADELQKWLK
jgi:hypothetical protein